jgi:hypothetical protein
LHEANSLSPEPDQTTITRAGADWNDSTSPAGRNMAHTRAADDFQTIRARMEELRRERERADDAERLRDPCSYRFVAPMAN